MSGYGDQIPALPPAPVVSAPSGGSRPAHNRAAAAAAAAQGAPVPGAPMTGQPAAYRQVSAPLHAAPPGHRAPAAPGAPSVGDLRLDARSPRSSGLGPAFAGTPASTGVRLLALTIDAVVAVGVGAVVLWLTQSVVLGILSFFEVVVLLLVMEARAGLTIGKALLRLRTARGTGPFSPGTGRSFVRGLISGASALVAVGPWVVEASSAWDASGRRRSWADRAAGTVVVAVPRKPTAAAAASAPASTVALVPPHVFDTSHRMPTLAASGGVGPLAPAAAAVPTPGAPASAPSAFVPAPLTPAPDRRFTAGDDLSGTDSHTDPRAASPVVGPAALAPDRPLQAEAGLLLLIFDTGQRVQLAVPAAVNLGRNPVASEQDDRLVVVDDPDGTVSKTHLRLEHSRGRTWVTDFGSTNGSDVLSDDGSVTELIAGARMLLEDGDRVRIGNRSVTITELQTGGAGA